jgi:dTMP kinase
MAQIKWPSRKGVFIAIEGPDGSGKSTAARNLAARLRGLGVDVVETRNVGGTPLAEQMRAITLDATIPLDPVQQSMVIAVARRSNLNEVVIPALERGAIVICDRFVASNLVFQTLNREGGSTISDADIVQLHEAYCYGAVPEMTLHVHAPAEVRLERRNMRGEGHDRFDNGDLDYDRAIAAKYQDAGRILNHPTTDIDGSVGPHAIVEQMMAAVGSLAKDEIRSVLCYIPRMGRWMAATDDNGRVAWGEAHEAHVLGASLSHDHEVAIVKRSVAIQAHLGGGLTTVELQTARRRS